MLAVGGPQGDLLWHKEFGVDAGHLIGQPGEVQILGNHTVLKRQDRLHQPQWSGGRLGMPEIGFHRGQRAGAVDAVDLGQAGVFDGVTDRGAGAVRLDHADARGVDVRSG